MPHLTKDQLFELLGRLTAEIRSSHQIPPTSLTNEEKEQLKMYIPMQLGEDSAKKMMTLVNAVREGKRPPLSNEERVAMNQENMEESLINFLSKLSTAGDEELEAMYEIADRIRSSRTDL